MYREKITKHYHLIYGDVSEVSCEVYLDLPNCKDMVIVCWNDPKHLYEWDYETFSNYSDMMEFVKTFP